MILKIVSNKRILAERKHVSSVSFQTDNGQTTVLPGHAPYLSLAIKGKLEFSENIHDRDGEYKNALNIESGIVKVEGNEVTVLVTIKEDINDT